MRQLDLNTEMKNPVSQKEDYQERSFTITVTYYVLYIPTQSHPSEYCPSNYHIFSILLH